MRTITKPSEATPIGAVRFPREAIQKVEQMFTAAESAQIAEAYDNAKCVYRNAISNAMTAQTIRDRERWHELARRALESVHAWESLFTQWQGK